MPAAASNHVSPPMVTIPRAGRYVIWAQVKLDGTERFVPFDFTVSN